MVFPGHKLLRMVRSISCYFTRLHTGLHRNPGEKGEEPSSCSSWWAFQGAHTQAQPPGDGKRSSVLEEGTLAAPVAHLALPPELNPLGEIWDREQSGGCWEYWPPQQRSPPLPYYTNMQKPSRYKFMETQNHCWKWVTQVRGTLRQSHLYPQLLTVQEKCVQIIEAAAHNPCVFLASLRPVPSLCQAWQTHIPWKDSWAGSSSKNTSLVLMASGHLSNCVDLFSLQLCEVRKHQCLYFAQGNSGMKRWPSSFVHPRQAIYAGKFPSSFTGNILLQLQLTQGKRLLLQPFATHPGALQH